MLKFLFLAELQDGSIIPQTEEDVSTTDPTKSAFFDVAARLDDVVAFTLFNPAKQYSPTYAVDLRTGLFSVNGNSFAVGDPRIQLPPETNYRLIYFRRVTHTLAQSSGATTHDVVFHFGWQATTAEGKNYQQTLAVK